MPTVKSKLKTRLETAVKDSQACLLDHPEEESAKRYAKAVRELVAVCEERNRY